MTHETLKGCYETRYGEESLDVDGPAHSIEHLAKKLHDKFGQDIVATDLRVEGNLSNGYPIDNVLLMNELWDVYYGIDQTSPNGPTNTWDVSPYASRCTGGNNNNREAQKGIDKCQIMMIHATQ